MPPTAMLPTTIAGSLPKPEWLAPPNVLWAPWRLEGRALEMARELSDLLGRKVDLVPKASLKPLIREEVLAEAEVLFAA